MQIVFVFSTLKAVRFLLVTRKLWCVMCSCMCDSAVTLRSPEIYNIQYTPAHGVNRLKGFTSGSNLKGI